MASSSSNFFKFFSEKALRYGWLWAFLLLGLTHNGFGQESGADRCTAAASKISQEMATLNSEYLQDVDEYKNSRFCSDCKQTASKIEREKHISYEQHILEGVNQVKKRESMTATPEMYAKLYTDYQRNLERFKQRLKEKNEECKQFAEDVRKEERLKPLRKKFDDLVVEEYKLIDSVGTSDFADKARLKSAKQAFESTQAEVSQLLSKNNEDLSSSDIQTIENKLNYMRQQNRELSSVADGAKSEQDKAKSKLDAEQKKDKNATTGAGQGGGSTGWYPGMEHDIEMEQRAKATRAATEAQDKAALTGVGVTAAVGGVLMQHEIDNNDDDEDLLNYLKGSLGLGLQEIPITLNMLYNGNQPKSQASVTNHLSVQVGVTLAIWNDRFLSFRASPSYSFGMNALSNTTTGTHQSYGFAAAVGLGHVFKVLPKMEYLHRSGSMQEDNATLGVDGIGSTAYKYSTLKYGLGVCYQLSGANSYIELSYYKENISFLAGRKAAVYSAEAKVSFGILGMSAAYGVNYPIAGELLYPNGYQPEKQNLLLLSLFVPFTIFTEF